MHGLASDAPPRILPLPSLPWPRILDSLATSIPKFTRGRAARAWLTESSAALAPDSLHTRLTRLWTSGFVGRPCSIAERKLPVAALSSLLEGWLGDALSPRGVGSDHQPSRYTWCWGIRPSRATRWDRFSGRRSPRQAGADRARAACRCGRHRPTSHAPLPAVPPPELSKSYPKEVPSGWPPPLRWLQPAAPCEKPVLHKIRDGDTLSALAQRYLGSPARAVEIFDANREILSNPELLPIGAELKIPPRRAARGAAAAAGAGHPAEPIGEPALTPARTG